MGLEYLSNVAEQYLLSIQQSSLARGSLYGSKSSIKRNKMLTRLPLEPYRLFTKIYSSRMNESWYAGVCNEKAKQPTTMVERMGCYYSISNKDNPPLLPVLSQFKTLNYWIQVASFRDNTLSYT